MNTRKQTKELHRAILNARGSTKTIVVGEECINLLNVLKMHNKITYDVVDEIPSAFLRRGEIIAQKSLIVKVKVLSNKLYESLNKMDNYIEQFVTGYLMSDMIFYKEDADFGLQWNEYSTEDDFVDIDIEDFLNVVMMPHNKRFVEQANKIIEQTAHNLSKFNIEYDSSDIGYISGITMTHLSPLNPDMIFSKESTLAIKRIFELKHKGLIDDGKSIYFSSPNSFDDPFQRGIDSLHKSYGWDSLRDMDLDLNLKDYTFEIFS